MKLFSLVHIVCQVALFTFLPLSFPVVAQTPPVPLSVAQAQVVEPARDEEQIHLLKLESNQFARIVIEQLGVDVAAVLHTPSGAVLAQSDTPNSANGDEFLFVVSEEPGEYQIRVTRQRTTSRGGMYRIELTEVREATSEDLIRQSAQQIGNEALALARRETAVESRQALEKYQAALARWRAIAEPRLEIQTLVVMGLIHLGLGEVGPAVDYYQQALARSRATGANRRDLTLVLGNLGVAQQLRGDLRLALNHHEDELRLLDDKHDIYQKAVTLNSLGGIHITLGDPRNALTQYRQALKISRDHGFSRIEGMCLDKIGSVHFSMAEFQLALNSFHQALRLHRASRDTTGEAVALNHIGLVHLSLGEYQRALEFFQQTLDMGLRTGNRGLISRARNYMGQVLLLQGDHQNASREFQDSLDISRKDGRQPETAESLNNLGDAEKAAKRPDRARDYYQNALEITRQIGDRRQEALIQTELGEVLASHGEPDRAAACFDAALALSRAVSDRRLEARALYQLAQLAERNGDLPGARSRIGQAIDIVETLRTKFLVQDMRVSFMGTVHDYYQLSVRTLMKMSQRPDDEYAIEALRINEMARARNMLELITESRADIRRDVPTPLIQCEKDLLIGLSAKREQLMRLASPSKPADQTRREAEILRQEIAAFENELGDLEARIRQASPVYASLTQPRPLQLAEIQRQVIRDRDTLLLEYALGDEASYLWLVSRDSVVAHRLPGRNEIEQSAHRLLKFLRGRPLGTPRQRQAHLNNFAQAARELSRKVLGPAAGRLHARRLIVVGDGILQYIPFAALTLPRNGVDPASAAGYMPLLTQYEIIGLPSATTLAVLRKELGDRKPAPRPLAVLADPVFGKYDDRVLALKPGAAGALSSTLPQLAEAEKQERSPNGDGSKDPSAPESPRRQNPDHHLLRFARLIYSRDEAEALRNLASDSMIALDFDANRQLIEGGMLSEYRTLHFALHGIIDDDRPEQSALVFSRVDQNGEPRNGLLYLNDIYNLKLPAELVVLSACQSGLGRQIKGEGIMGWTRGFMHAGAKRVISSLWNVNDKATAELMKRFYQGMLGNPQLTPSAALRQAQLAIWKETKWQAPYFGAPFVLQGEW
jgi:CHAT domain-containing protein/tetratricopeptide (TPR) repeat protein